MNAVSSSLGSWQALKLSLQIEAEKVLASSGKILVVMPDDESGSVLTLESENRSLKVTWIPERNAIRWDTDKEYSFERVTNETAALAHKLVERLRRL